MRKIALAALDDAQLGAGEAPFIGICEMFANENGKEAATLSWLACSGLLIPDTKLGGRIAISEVFNEQTTSILFGRVQT